MLIRGAIVVTPDSEARADVRIAGEQFVEVGPDLERLSGETVMDAGGLHLFPGLVDSHVHFRDPGQTAKEDFDSGSAAAAAGGVTTVLCMPNTLPPLATAEALEEAKARALSLSRVDFGLEAVVTPGNAGHLLPLIEAGPISFEVFLGGVPEAIHDTDRLARVFATLGAHDCIVGVTPADHRLRESRSAAARASGRTDPLVFAEAYPPEIEVNGILQAVAAARAALASLPSEARLHLHFRQIHAQESVNLLGALAGSPGRLVLTSEVSPHHLFLTRDHLAALHGLAQMIPPLRSKADNDALLAGLKNGVISSIATDHAPHEREKKELGKDNIWQSPPGVPALETLLPALLTAAHEGTLTRSDIAAWTAAAPARIFRLHGKGRIGTQCDADFVLVDTGAIETVDPSRHYTRAKSSPFAGQELRGQVIRTVRRGATVFSIEDGCAPPGGGRQLMAFGA